MRWTSKWQQLWLSKVASQNCRVIRITWTEEASSIMITTTGRCTNKHLCNEDIDLSRSLEMEPLELSIRAFAWKLDSKSPLKLKWRVIWIWIVCIRSFKYWGICKVFKGFQESFGLDRKLITPFWFLNFWASQLKTNGSFISKK